MDAGPERETRGSGERRPDPQTTPGGPLTFGSLVAGAEVGEEGNRPLPRS